MARFNHQRVAHNDRVKFRPSPRSRPATQAQLNYIYDLALMKGRPVSPSRMPKTLYSASELIQKLLLLPDAEGHQILDRLSRPIEENRPTDLQEMAVELREQFRQLTPIQANSMVQLFASLDELGAALTFDEVMKEETPGDPDELVLYILRRFLANFAPVSDDGALAA